MRVTIGRATEWRRIARAARDAQSKHEVEILHASAAMRAPSVLEWKRAIKAGACGQVVTACTSQRADASITNP